jgi:hypothetical protein
MPTIEELNEDLDEKRAAHRAELEARLQARAKAAAETKDPTERALAYDEIQRDAARAQEVADNKARNAPRVPQFSDERLARATDVQRMRSDLGGFASMPTEVRNAPEVRGYLWPKVEEYVRARLELAAEMTVDMLVTELRLSRADITTIIAKAAGNGVSAHESFDDAPTPVVEPPAPSSPYHSDRIAHLEQQVATLNARVLELGVHHARAVHLPAWADEAQQRLADLEEKVRRIEQVTVPAELRTR